MRKLPLSRIYNQILHVNSCWEWQGHKTKGGYGRISAGPRHVFTHRVSYELAHGEIPPGMIVCHRCDNPCCINPAHLFVGTPQDNTDDMMRKGRHKTWSPQKDKPTCKHGHDFTPDNTIVSNRGHRICKECKRRDRQEYADKRRLKNKTTTTTREVIN